MTTKKILSYDEKIAALKLGTPKEEAAKCKAAFKRAGTDIGDLCLHIHHEILIENLHESIENRIEYILKTKTDNIPLRLRLMRPFVLTAQMKKNKELETAWNEYDKAKNECDKAKNEYDKAKNEYNKVWDKYDKAKNEYDKVWDKYNKAQDEYSKAWNEYSKAGDEFDKARDEFDKTFILLYPKYFPKSTWNGRSILNTYES